MMPTITDILSVSEQFQKKVTNCALQEFIEKDHAKKLEFKNGKIKSQDVVLW